MPVHPDDALWTRPKSTMSDGYKALGLVLFTAACLTSLLVWMNYNAACITYEGQQPACFGRSTEYSLHLVLAIVGWAAAALMLHFAFRGPRRAFVALLVLALVLYTVSILFADAGLHGWDSLKLFPTFD
jgi:hypothetical protein